jgi:hypothetical protein
MRTRRDAQIHFRESEEVVVCHFRRKVCNSDQLLEPRSGDVPPGATTPPDSTTDLIPSHTPFAVTRRLGKAYAQV